VIEIVPTLGRWPRAPLGELCDIRGGFPAPQDDAAFEEGEIPFVRMKDVGRHHFTNNLCETDQSLSRAHFEEGRYQLTPRGSILMPRSGSVGLNHRAILTIDAVVVSHLCALVPTSDKVTTDFLYRFLCLADMRKLTKKTTGLDSIAFSDLRMVAIPLPPLAEQRRIAEVLDRAEALRAKRRAALAQLDSLTQSLFLDLFGDPAANTKQFPTPRLAEAIELRGGFAFKSGDYVPEGIPLVRIGEVNRGGVTRENACFLPVTHEVALARFIVRPGDMLMSLTGTTGKDDYANVILLNRTFDRYFLNQRVALIEPKPNVLDRHYLLHVFRNPKVKARLTSKNRGIRQANISNGDVLDLELPVPPITLQREFARRVTAVEALKTAQRASLAELDALFATLQHRAFRGEL